MADFDAFDGPDLFEEVGSINEPPGQGLNSFDGEPDFAVPFTFAWTSEASTAVGVFETAEIPPDIFTTIRLQRIYHRADAENRIPIQLRKGNNPAEAEFGATWSSANSTITGSFG